MTFEYILKTNPRSKRLTIRIKSDGIVVVTKPRRITIAEAKYFIDQKKDWVNAHLKNIKSKPIVPKMTKQDYEIYKIQSLKFAEEKLRLYNQHYNFSYKKISIKKQKTRWGSCSRKGNLNFNYKLALIPERLADYIVVHELCHLGQFNHSYKFWNLVGETIPDYMKRREELKRIGL